VAHCVIVWSMGTAMRGIPSWLCGLLVAGVVLLMLAARRNCTVRAHICCVGAGAVSCIVLISWVIPGRVSFACSSNVGTRRGGRGMRRLIMVEC